ncbi:MAG: hypothetical protein H6587_08075 [Flavobacteriales bacterium]|nr:hypothetical protein [Flavobacteriales bacterium]MCB9364510.1 hypothetical protein [Flavobacteriales bacterium]
MQKIFILLITILLIPVLTHAQKWKRNRVEYSFGIGATNFLGDLGGANQVGTNGLRDFELQATRMGAVLGYRYQLGESWFVRGNFDYVMVSGDDALTEEPARNSRQLSFRSHLLELSGQLEYMLVKQKSGHLYRLRGVRGKSWFRFEVYVFAGIGGLWYNPQSRNQDGDWVSLKNLNTEGQGLPGGPKDYSGMTVVVPYGLGIRRNLGGSTRQGMWTIGLELSMRKTFSDYIDDVSNVYYDNSAIQAEYGDEAAYFADPSGLYHGLVDDGKGGKIGQQRGDKDDKDAYMMGIISLNYKIGRRRRNLPKF